MRLKDKVAIVTGAASGIGRSTAQVFAREGCKVALVDINEEGLKETLNSIGEEQAFVAPATFRAPRTSSGRWIRPRRDSAGSRRWPIATVSR